MLRIRVNGTCPSADSIRMALRKAGFCVSDFLAGDAQLFHEAGYEITVEEAEGPHVVVDGIDCWLERHIVNRIAELLAQLDPPRRILLDRPGPTASDREIRLSIPPNDAVRVAVETGVVRGLLAEIDGRPKPKEAVPPNALQSPANVHIEGPLIALPETGCRLQVSVELREPVKLDCSGLVEILKEIKSKHWWEFWK